MAFDQNWRFVQDCTAGQECMASTVTLQSWPKPQKLLKIEKKNNLYIGGPSVCLSVCLSVSMYSSNAHRFGPIGMKIGMYTPWDPESDMG